MSAPVLLSDAQIQQFICDGFLIIKPKMDPAIHKTIDDKFNWLSDNEANPGNNILARLPELNKILNSPEVKGAMISLLGDDYIKVPHCFWHNREAGVRQLFGVENSEEKSYKEIVGGNSHQDSYVPASMAKTHPLQYLRFMYYSHDMKLKNGPTHVSPGTQYHSRVSDEDRDRETPVLGQAGTIFLSHFELVHAGSPNQSNRTRNMIKFLFTRSQNMKKPSWNHKKTSWVKQNKIIAPYELDNCWKQQWRWVCNQKPTKQEVKPTWEFDALQLEKTEDIKKRITLINNIGYQPKAIETLLSLLNHSHQAIRTSSVYALGVMGKEAVKPLQQFLKNQNSKDKEIPRASGVSISLDDTSMALIACGQPALEGLEKIVDLKNDWLCINILHVIAVLGQSNDKVNKKVIQCLKSKSDLVISFAATALGRVGDKKMIPVMLKILKTKYDVKRHNEMVHNLNNGQWPHEWVVHFNAALALVRLSKYAKPFESEISKHLDHPCGQVTILLCECLNRIGTKTALQSQVDFYTSRRWDDSLCASRCF